VSFFAWYSNSDEYATVDGVSIDDAKALRFDLHLGKTDEPVSLEIVLDPKRPLPLGDFPNTGIAYPKCLSERAYQALSHLLEPCGVIKTALLDGQVYYLFWPTTQYECLDLKRSEISTTTTGYQRVVKPVFLKDFDPEKSVFLASAFPRQCVFVGECFMNAVESSGLVGLELRKTLGDAPEIIRPNRTGE